MDLRESREIAAASCSRHPWELARVQVVHRLLNSQLAGRQPEMILDIGCGDAFVAEQVSQRYPTARILAVDTELDEATRDRLSARLTGRQVSLYRSLQEAASQPATADVVLLLDVIEHIADDVAFLSELRHCPLVTPQTLFLITVPAHQGSCSSHDEFLGHYRRYNNQLLVEHLAGPDTTARRAATSFSQPCSFESFRRARKRLLKGRARRAIGLAGWRGGPLATRVIQLMLQTDFACSRILRRLGIRLPGLSNYALCKTSAS